MLAAVKNRLNLAENPIKGSHGQKRACAMQALCHG